MSSHSVEISGLKNIYVEEKLVGVEIPNVAEDQIEKISILDKKILFLLEKYILTINEICSYFLEQDDVFESIESIQVSINQLMLQGSVISIVLDSGINVLSSNQERNKLSVSEISEFRKESLLWVKKNIIFSLFSESAQNMMFHTIKYLKRNNFNHYYQPFDPVYENQEVQFRNQKGVLLSTNDYLGLAKNLDILTACHDALNKFGNGVCGSRISIGTTSLHLELEKKLSQLKKTEGALIFSSGYLTNFSFLSTLGKNTVVIYDALAHACIIDGIQFSECESIRFKHNDCLDLERKIKKIPDDKQKLIYIESVYSLDGDIAKLPELIKIAKQYNAKIAVDEAHSTGTFGRGICEFLSIDPNDIDFYIGTLSKAIASEGGFICASSKVIELLKYTARPMLFTTSRAIPPVAGAIKALEIIDKNPDLGFELQQKAKRVRETLRLKGFNIGNSESQVIPIMIGETEKTLQIQSELQKEGFFIIAAIYPAVPPKKARLRLNVTLAQTEEDLNRFIDRLSYFSEKMGII